MAKCNQLTPLPFKGLNKTLNVSIVHKLADIRRQALCHRCLTRCYDFIVVYSRICCATVSSCLMTRTTPTEYAMLLASLLCSLQLCWILCVVFVQFAVALCRLFYRNMVSCIAVYY